MFITPAYAQSAGGGADAFIQLVPILLMFVIFYFLLIRPQQARAKRHQEMINAIRRNDTVVIGGGIVGRVNRVRDGDPEIDVEIAQGVKIKVVKSTLADVLQPGGKPAND